MLHSLPTFVILCLSFTFAIHVPSPSPRERIISIDGQKSTHTTALLAKETNTGLPAHHSALPLGSHPLSGGIGLTVEEEVYDLKQEMRYLKADYDAMKKDLDILSAELEDLRGVVLGMVMERWGTGGAGKAVPAALKEQVRKQQDDER